jgi:hypothetical protein
MASMYDGSRGLHSPSLRKARLPTGGTYDHAPQEMKGYNLRIADTGTATDEDHPQSTTFWDGETK